MPSDTEEEGKAIKTDPALGTPVALQSRVTLYVPRRNDTVQVPDVKGLNQDAARKAMTDAGLTVGNVDSQDAAGVAAGLVIKTDPGAGDEVARDTPVTLILASGNVTVPNVVGKSIKDARKLLNEQGLNVDTVKAPSAEVAPGTVTAQNPSPKSTVKVGSSVEVTIAEPPAVTTTAPEP